jgi:PEP-CTERM motif
MKKATIRGAAAAAFTIGFASLAQAVPIYFDFTGTVSSSSVLGPEGAVGQTVSGGFTLESDRLVLGGGAPTQRTWLDFQPTGLAEPLAHLDIGGRNVAFPLNTGQSFALVNYSDNCTTAGCVPFGTDNFSIFVSSALPAYAPDFTGTLWSSSFYFASTAITRPPGGPAQPFDYFDIADIELNSMLTLPLHDVVAFLGEETLDCVAGSCTSIEQRSYSFSIDTVSRGTGVRSVPEPGTLGLLGAGLLAAFVTRRRVSDPQHA